MGSDFPLIFDSGIRDGESILKALACGADFVMLGRSVLYGMGAGGEKGLDQVLSVLINELDLAMAQLGCADINEVGQQMLVKR